MDIKELAKKLRALAQDGDDEETRLAEIRLRQLLKKHGMTEEELDEEEPQMFEIRYKEEWERMLIMQVGYKVLNDCDHFYTRRNATNNRKFKLVLVKCTKAQHIEILMMYHYYQKLFEDEFDWFFKAFIQKHELFGKSTAENPEQEIDIATLQRMLRMQSIMKSGDYHKQLKG